MTKQLGVSRDYANPPLAVTDLQLHILFLILILIVGEFAKFRKATITFVMSVCPSAWDTTIPTGGILIGFAICVFFENLPRKFKFD